MDSSPEMSHTVSLAGLSDTPVELHRGEVTKSDPHDKTVSFANGVWRLATRGESGAKRALAYLDSLSGVGLLQEGQGEHTAQS